MLCADMLCMDLIKIFMHALIAESLISRGQLLNYRSKMLKIENIYALNVENQWLIWDMTLKHQNIVI